MVGEADGGVLRSRVLDDVGHCTTCGARQCGRKSFDRVRSLQRGKCQVADDAAHRVERGARRARCGPHMRAGKAGTAVPVLFGGLQQVRVLGCGWWWSPLLPRVGCSARCGVECLVAGLGGGGGGVASAQRVAADGDIVEARSDSAGLHQSAHRLGLSLTPFGGHAVRRLLPSEACVSRMLRG